MARFPLTVTYTPRSGSGLKLTKSEYAWMEPDSQNLLISTSGPSGNGKVFFWYQGRPRRIAHSKDTLHSIVANEKRIVALAGEDIHGVGYARTKGIVDILSGERYRIDNLSRIALADELLYGIADAGIFVPDTPGSSQGRTPDKLVTLAGNVLRDVYMHTCRMSALTMYRNTPFMLCTDRPEMGTGKDGAGTQVIPQHIVHVNGTRIWERNDHNEYWSMSTADEHLLLGGTGVILELHKHADQGWRGRRHLFSPVAAQVYERLGECAASGDYKWRVPEAQVRILAKQGIDVRASDTMGENEYHIKQQCLARNVEKYQGKVCYTTAHELRALGLDEPLHVFRDTITGMAVVSESVKRELINHADMRMGSHKGTKGALRLVA